METRRDEISVICGQGSNNGEPSGVLKGLGHSVCGLKVPAPGSFRVPDKARKPLYAGRNGEFFRANSFVRKATFYARLIDLTRGSQSLYSTWEPEPHQNTCSDQHQTARACSLLHDRALKRNELPGWPCQPRLVRPSQRTAKSGESIQLYGQNVVIDALRPRIVLDCGAARNGEGAKEHRVKIWVATMSLSLPTVRNQPPVSPTPACTQADTSRTRLPTRLQQALSWGRIQRRLSEPEDY